LGRARAWEVLGAAEVAPAVPRNPRFPTDSVELPGFD